MRTFTFHGIAPDPNPGDRPKAVPTFSTTARPKRAPTFAMDQPEPVFLLKSKVGSVRKQQAARHFPDPGQRVIFAGPSMREQRWPFETEVQPGPEPVEHEAVLEDWMLDGSVPQPLTKRQKGVRTMAIFAIGMFFLVSATIFTDPDAQREVLSWATLGHAEQILNAFR